MDDAARVGGQALPERAQGGDEDRGPQHREGP